MDQGAAPLVEALAEYQLMTTSDHSRIMATLSMADDDATARRLTDALEALINAAPALEVGEPMIQNEAPLGGPGRIPPPRPVLVPHTGRLDRGKQFNGRRNPPRPARS